MLISFGPKKNEESELEIETNEKLRSLYEKINTMGIVKSSTMKQDHGGHGDDMEI